MKSPSNESGFSLIAIIVVAMVLAILGVSGYYVWHRGHNGGSRPPVASSYISGSQSSGPNDSGSHSSSSTGNVLVFTSFSAMPSAAQQAVVKLANLELKTTSVTNNSCEPSDIFPGNSITTFVNTNHPLYWEATGNFVAFTNGCGDMVVQTIGAKVGGTWQLVYGFPGEGLIPCDPLNKFNVPVDLLAKFDSLDYANGSYTCSVLDKATNSYDKQQTYSGPQTG